MEASHADMPPVPLPTPWKYLSGILPMVSAPSSMTVPIPSLRATFFAPPSGTNPPIDVRRSAVRMASE